MNFPLSMEERQKRHTACHGYHFRPEDGGTETSRTPEDREQRQGRIIRGKSP